MSYWTGGHKRYDNRGWCWGDAHTPITLFDWDSGEPNSGAGDERCIEMIEHERRMRWNDALCGIRRYYICEMEVDTEIPLD